MEELNKATDCIIFFVNGRKILLNQPDPEITLLQFLRDHLGLKGTKLGCAEGGCGACTVMVSNYNHKTKTVNHFSVNACLAPLCSVDHMAVTTVEGIGSTRTKIHPVQERIAKAHGSQCGFCTPGIVMSMYTLLRNNVRPTEEEMERAFEGNLCRCTGYRPILDAFRTFCCKGDGGNCACSKGDNTGVIEGPYALFDPTEFQPLDPTQEPIFPPELMISTTPPPLHIKTDQVQWFRPSTLQQLLSIKVKYLEKVRIVAGNSEIGVEVKFKSAHFPVLVSPAQIPEMNVLEETDDGLLIGAACTLSEAEVKMKEICNRLPHHKTRTLVAILEMLRLFAGPQIRNVAVIGGNIVTASPISDLNPILVAAGAVLNITSKNAPQYSRKIDESFFVSYRKTVLKHDEVLVSLVIPWTQEHEFVYGYKQSLRRDDDIAIVNAGMRVVVCEEDRKWKVKEISLVYGGMAPVTKVASKTQSKLIGREWNDSLCDDACSSLIEEMKIPLNAPGGRPEFRCSLNASFFLKFYLTVKNEISCIPHELLSATKPFRKELTKASQGFQNVAGSQPSDDVVGRPLMHLSALQQATGEAIYVDDMPSYKDELHAAIVVSSRPHAEIIDIDISEAAEVEGFVDFISAQDIPDEGSNMTGAGPFGIKDEEVFADRKVTCIGQLVGLVVAKSRPLAQRAAKLVKIEYKDLPAIITIEEAIDAAAFYEPKCHSFTVGDTEAALATADHVLSGEIRVGGQEHFYLETQSVLAVPKDVGELEMFVSTQNAHKTQMLAATAIGVPGNRVVVHAKRLGGGFGGKETRHCIYSTSMAVAANKLQVPLRLMLDRDEDMTTTGTRHPYLGRYKVGFNKDGKLLALDTRFYSNAGNSTDLSLPVMERSAMHCENAYYIPNVKASGYACKTNIPSNTAFRAFGRPQTMYMMECVISIVADVCNFPVHKVREMNLYKEGDMTPGNQLLTDFHLQQSWDELMTKIQYEDRVVAVEEFNKRNQWTKRGIAMIPTKFGVGFPPPLSQGGALVHVYTDGSVLLAHGGVEMGQGLHTKMVQVCARALGVSHSKVHISEMATNTVANASPTAASVGADLHGMAIKNACEKIKERLAPYTKNNPGGTWEEWVDSAYKDMINLSAQGFYSIQDMNFSWETKVGRYVDYFTSGVACSEVEVDMLTGGHHIISTDIIMDVGDSLNPAIDIGQIEGAFAQGVGLFTMEEFIFLEETDKNPRGQMYTNGPRNYKIPCFSDVPLELNVALLKGSPNKRAIYSSRAVGEPPLFLGASVAFAIRDAIATVRRQAGVTECFTLDSPVTCERIRMACPDHITKQVLSQWGPDIATAKRWNVVV